MNKYYEVTAEIDGETDVLYGSFLRSECVYELDAEKDSWKGEGYKKFKIITKETEAEPDKTVYNLQHSTFYAVPFASGSKKRIYTTIKNTPHHAFLRDEYEGKTYLHDESAALYFIEGMLLSKPIPVIKEVK